MKDPDAPLAPLLVHDFWGQYIAKNDSHKSFRPLTVLTYRLTRQAAGGVTPYAFHVANAALHALNSGLVFETVLVLSAHGGPGIGTPRAALLAAFMFALHPVHAEAVAGIVGRAEVSQDERGGA